MEAKIIFLSSSGKEVHFPKGNNAAAVCWNTKTTMKSIKGEDGLTYKAEVQERVKQDPYIDFVTVREADEGEFYEDDDSPVRGGLSIEDAESLATELTRAVTYIKSLKKGK